MLVLVLVYYNFYLFFVLYNFGNPDADRKFCIMLLAYIIIRILSGLMVWESFGDVFQMLYNLYGSPN